MSRVGLLPIPLPQGVQIDINEDGLLTVKGPKGELSREINPEMALTVGETEITVARPSDSKLHKSQHGLARALVANMVEGVSTGFSKELEIEGVGYRAELKGKNLQLALGFSHPVIVEPFEGITFEVSAPTQIKVSGYDKEKVGQMAANIRGWRPPEPYKGKGVRYKGEHIIRKAGKAAAKE
ncbi:MAG: 50S ribosomal protein L6 [Candidatus Krumholzibacteria bacterium]|jgi:large subunit ribosomal protein L6|nr:50S ribosomal protein L6 [Candidatus Krumholzibacteria bacterium]MDP7022059.1 50S ribosomal protein L6 [Candidatus Krumholzibacteria bacterium]